MNILLIYGAKSCEHDVSLISGCLAKGYFDGNLICAYLDQNNNCYLVPNNLTPIQHKQEKFDTTISFAMGQKCIYLHKGRRAKRVDIDVAVNCCHGVNGEDGAVAGILQMAGIPSVESGVIPSAICMDKYLSKLLFKGANLPVLDGVLLTREQFDCRFDQFVCTLNFPVIVKPTTLGSSIGVAIANDSEQLEKALQVAFSFDERVLVERALTNFFEVNCSAMTVDGKVVASQAESPVSSRQILTFFDKYLAGGKGFSPKSTVEQAYCEQAQQLTKQIYQLLDMQGVVRVDFIVDKQTGVMYVNEVNVVPGSLAYNLWSKQFEKHQFGKALVDSAIVKFAKRSSLTYRYNSTVLEAPSIKK